MNYLYENRMINVARDYSLAPTTNDSRERPSGPTAQQIVQLVQSNFNRPQELS